MRIKIKLPSCVRLRSLRLACLGTTCCLAFLFDLGFILFPCHVLVNMPTYGNEKHKAYFMD